jgi:hypothetical protein
MIRNAATLLILTVVLVSGTAWAGPMSLALGETKFLVFMARSAKVELTDASVVAVKTSRSGVELRALRAGVSQVTLRLNGGETYEFAVHVTPSGAHLYSTNRAEPEHSDFSLTPAPVRAEKQAPKAAPTAEKKAKPAPPQA